MRQGEAGRPAEGSPGRERRDPAGVASLRAGEMGIPGAEVGRLVVPKGGAPWSLGWGVQSAGGGKTTEDWNLGERLCAEGGDSVAIEGDPLLRHR